MSRRLALAALLALVLAAGRVRDALEIPGARTACAPQGRGEPPRHWLGCAADAGPPRALAGDERLVLGLPIDPNTASSRELAFVPGLSRRLAAELVLDRERNGPYGDVADIVRVRGIGPKKLAAAAPHLAVSPP
ncbi:MAG TPA: helix-hairpin-helix domain-containing protein [Anaeromyxobacter sp.]